MSKLWSYFDLGSLVVIVVTLVLFLAALWIKGLTHDLLLEAGVFLVSVKLIVMSYKQGVAAERMHQQLDELTTIVKTLSDRGAQRGEE